MEWYEKTAVWLTAVGALNWGLTAMGFNIVEKFIPAYAKWIYYAIGLAGAYSIYVMLKK